MTDELARGIARQVMSDFLGVPLDEVSENSHGGRLIREGIRRYRASQASDRPSELVERLLHHADLRGRSGPMKGLLTEAAARLAQQEAAMREAREQGQREGRAAVCDWLRHFTAMKPSPDGAEKVAALADMFERSEQAYEDLSDKGEQS